MLRLLNSPGEIKGHPLLVLGGAILACAAGVAIAVQPLVAIAFVGLACTLALGIVRTDYLIILCVPILAMPDTFIFNTSSKLVVIGALVVCWVLGILDGRWRLSLQAHGALGGLAFVLSLSYLTSSTALDLPTFDRGAHLTGFLAAILLTAVVVSVPIDQRRLVQVLGLTGLLVVLMALRSAAGGGRLTTLTGNPNTLGILVSMGLLAALTLAAQSWRSPWWALVVLAVLALFGTGSRSAYIAAVLGVLALFMQNRRRVIFLLLCLVGVLVLALTPSLQLKINEAAFSDRNSAEIRISNTVRAGSVVQALDYIARDPFTGIGYGLFSASSKRDTGVYINTHNDYLRLAAETGLAGLIIFLGLLVMAFRATIGQHSRFYQGGRAILVCYLVGLLFGDNLANLQVSGGFWILLGAFLACKPSSNDRQDSGSQKGGLGGIKDPAGFPNSR